MRSCDSSVVRCLQVHEVIVVHAIFYLKYNLIDLLYVQWTLFVHNHDEFTTICNIYQFIQRMNKAYHMSSNYITSLHQFKIIKIVRNFCDA